MKSKKQHDRQFVYETGAVDPGKGNVPGKRVGEKARKKSFKISRAATILTGRIRGHFRNES